MNVLGLILSVVVLAGSGVSPAPATAAADGSDARPAHLQVEHVTDPMAVDAAKPRLTWSSPWTGPDLQAQAQVQVSRSSSFDGALVWESPQVATTALGIAYDGPALVGGERYWWRVSTWSATHEWSGWSAPSWWSQGLTTEAEWRGATWISATPSPAPRTTFDPIGTALPAPAFRHPFALPSGKQVEWATATIAGLGMADVWLDGARVDESVLQATSDFGKTVLYRQHDISEQLREGSQHVLGVVLGSGFYSPQAPDAKITQGATWIDVRKLRAVLTIRYTDGTTDHRVSGTTGWTQSATASGISFDSPYSGETMTPDAGGAVREPWTLESYDASAWQPVVVPRTPTGVLRGQVAPAMRRIETVPLTLHNPAPGVWVYAAPTNMTGWARITLGPSTPAGAKVTVKYDETLIDQGFIDRFPGLPLYVRSLPQYGLVAPSPSRIGQVAGVMNSHPTDAARRWQTDVVTTIERRQTFEPRFTYKGFQYIQIEGLSEPPESVVAYQVHSAVDRVGSFETDDPFLSRLHAANLLTYTNNLQGAPTDCPTREKRTWLADAALGQGTGMLNYDTIAIYEQYLRDIRDAQDANGSMPNFAPTPGPGKYDSTATGEQQMANPWWGGAGIQIAWEIYRATGDTRVLADNYDMMTRYITYLRTVISRASEFRVGDWQTQIVASFTTIDPATGLANPVVSSYQDLYGRQETDPAAMYTLAYFLQVTIAAKAAAALGKEADANRYAGYAALSKASINATWYSADEHRYELTTTPRSGTGIGDRQPTLTSVAWLAIVQALGITPAGEGAHVDAQLTAAIADFGGGMPTGLFGTQFLFDALAQYEHDDLAYRMMSTSEPGRPSYWGMLQDPGGTIWEIWAPVGVDASHDHPAFTTPENWMYGRVAGITTDRWDPLAPITISPTPVGNATRASASTRVVGGTVSVSWQLVEDDGMTVDVTIPQGRSATVALPWDRDVLIDDVIVSGVRKGDRTVYPISSGTHRIVSVPPPPVTATHDLTGDGRNDLVTRTVAGTLMVSAGDGSGRFGSAHIVARGWKAMTAVVVGTFDGDENADILGRDSAGRLWLYRGDGAGGLADARVRIGASWKGFSGLFSPGDVDGDGDSDLIARDSRGYLWVYRGDGTGQFGSRTRVDSTTGWKNLAVFGNGDVTGDGLVDILIRHKSGKLFVMPGDGTGRFGTRILLASGWGAYTALVTLGDLTGDRAPDIVTRDKSGRLWLFANDGSGTPASGVQIGSGFQKHKFAT